MSSRALSFTSGADHVAARACDLLAPDDGDHVAFANDEVGIGFDDLARRDGSAR